MNARNIRPEIVALILDYGEPRRCRGGTQGYALTRAGMSAIRKDHGPAAANAFAPYQYAPVVVANGRVMTIHWKRHRQWINFSRNRRGR